MASYDECGFLQGTFVVTPHVAGAAAVLLTAELTATAAELCSAIVVTQRDDAPETGASLQKS